MSGAVPAAFSLLEVMVALAIFFASAFAILTLVSGGLANARYLERPQVDAAAVASIYSMTNKIVESTESGNLGDLLGDIYRGYTWESTSVEVESNKLFRVDFMILQPGGGASGVFANQRALLPPAVPGRQPGHRPGTSLKPP